MEVPFLAVSPVVGSAAAAAGTIGPTLRYLNWARHGPVLASEAMRRNSYRRR